VPVKVAVPLALSVNVTPVGRAPVSVIAAVGVPVVVTMNVSPVPTVNVAALPLVMPGAAETVTVRVCWPVPKLFAADRAIAYVPAVVGVPARVAVPFPLSVKVRPGGTLSHPKLGPG
jgi:hypothetical protein